MSTERPRETYQHAFTSVYDVTKALELVEANGIPFRRVVVPVASLMTMTQQNPTEEYQLNAEGVWERKGDIFSFNMLSPVIDAKYLSQISEERMKEPVLMVQAEFEGQKYYLLIDGNHRAVRHSLDGIEQISAILIEEPAAIAQFYTNKLAKTRKPRRKTAKLNLA